MQTKFLTDTGITQTNELEPVLDALAEINVQLRHVLQISKTVILDLEMRGRVTDAFEEIELDLKKQSILANMSRTEEAIGKMNQEISALLRRGSGQVPIRSGISDMKRNFEPNVRGLRSVSEP